VANALITPDPLGRQISMVVVNGSFTPYDSTRPAPGWNERARWFAGTVVAPDIGAGGGLSMLIVRGLAINAGVAVLAIRTPASGERIGNAPMNAVSPFRAGAAAGGFVGISYNFK
jgi:hypothetical protein